MRYGPFECVWRYDWRSAEMGTGQLDGTRIDGIPGDLPSAPVGRVRGRAPRGAAAEDPDRRYRGGLYFPSTRV